MTKYPQNKEIKKILSKLRYAKKESNKKIRYEDFTYNEFTSFDKVTATCVYSEIGKFRTIYYVSLYYNKVFWCDDITAILKDVERCLDMKVLNYEIIFVKQNKKDTLELGIGLTK